MKKMIVNPYTKEEKYLVEGKEEFKKLGCLISLYKKIDDRYFFVAMVYSDDIKTMEWDSSEPNAIDNINNVTFGLHVYPFITESVYKYYLENGFEEEDE